MISSNTRVAEVDSKGLVLGVNAGTATITVKTTDGKYSDAIYVVNKDGYIGESTKSEIEFAKEHNKEIMYLESIE